MINFLEAVVMQRHSTLLAHEKRLVVPLPLNGALLAVSPLGGALAVHLGGNNPVVETVEPGQVAGGSADPLPAGRGAVSLKELQDKLPHERQERLLLACGPHPEPPGVYSANAEAPSVNGKPPFLDPIASPTKRIKKLEIFLM